MKNEHLGSNFDDFLEEEGLRAVLLSASDNNELEYRKSFLDSVERGIEDAENGRTQMTEELRKSLQSRRSAGKP